MTVIIDTREPLMMRALVLDSGSAVDTGALPAGDYVAGEHLVERKDWSDFASRLVSGSFFDQIRDLASSSEESGLSPVLVVEGRRGLEHTSIEDEQLIGALARAAQMGVTIIPTLGMEETARFVSVLSREAPGEPAIVRPPPDAPDDPRDVAAHVLGGVPGVGPSTAGSLLDEFGSVAGVASSSRDELESVDGVGPMTADALISAFREA